MNNFYGLILTLITGLFFLIGGFISLKVKKKEEFNHFSIALAFVIIMGLLIFDLAPECLELLENYNLTTKIILIIVFLIVGILILKILDLFIPDHHHDHHEENDNLEEHQSHLKHIGVLTIVSLALHNILEGFAICGMVSNDIKIGILTCLSVALHNIPLGCTIFSAIDVKQNKGLMTFLTLSSVIGGIIYLLVGGVSDIVLAIITIITMGMLIYIAFFELFGEVKQEIKNHSTIIGLICGIIILVISSLV